MFRQHFFVNHVVHTHASGISNKFLILYISNEHIKWALTEIIVCNVTGIYFFRARVLIAEMVEFLLVVMIFATCTKPFSIIPFTLSHQGLFPLLPLIELFPLIHLIQMVCP